MKVGDLIRHKNAPKAGNGIVTKVSRPSCTHPPSGNPVYVEAVWSGDWLNRRSIEQQYLEVISEGR